ncbi:FUSC family protein [Actinacidiphila guanduensis]|uniref:Fusaric acid resistance protein-like n=1 Tax=Actinacidiphila guanduensis TaxID=310781 RepID=A0A1H0L012_9ACTN|nr:FUSC family protein [Actinacidiphila guanduensis]SDO61558.1 Fusaric acid resistance protein-like [Actinacidiphila guanduensis]
MAGATGQGRPRRGPRAVTWLATLFRLDPAGANWTRAVLFLDIALVPLMVFWAIGDEQYLLSAVFGLLFAALADPGGGLGHRAAHIALFGLIGAGVTALAFGIGGAAWGWLALLAFAVTLAAGLAVAFGVGRFANALLLNVWFVVALGLAFGLHHHTRITSHTWVQTLAWAAGSASWIIVALVGRLVRRRAQAPRPFAELPGDTSRRKLTPQLIAFAVLRALAIAGTVALAFGLDLANGYWMPVAAIAAMKPSLQQTALAAAQRLIGAMIGAAVAVLLLLLPAGVHGRELFAVKRGLEVVALVLLMHAVAIRFLNYALYCAAIAAAVLLMIDLPQTSHHAAEAHRVLWTLCGGGIGLLVMLLAALLARRSPRAARRT